LPAVIGAGLMFATGGASAAAMPGLFGLGMPATIGLGVGALQAARTGNLQKGLMAGLGAYGGAGLTGGLMGAGASALDATQTALGAPNVATGPGSQAAMLAAQNEGFGQAGLEALGQSAGYAKDAMPFVQTPLQSVTRGAQGLLEPAGREALVREVGGKAGLAKLGLAAAAPMMLDATTPKTQMPAPDREQYRYAYTPGRTANRPDDYQGEYTYFRPSYTRLAAGGPVEAMSAANVYAMQNARGGVSDMGIDNSTGMQRMADGGTAETSGYEGYQGYSQPGENQYKYAYDPKTQKYREIVPSVLPVVAGLAALNASNYGNGYGGGDMSQGYGMGFGATSGQLGPGASQAEMDAISNAAHADAVSAAANEGYGVTDAMGPGGPGGGESGVSAGGEADAGGAQSGGGADNSGEARGGLMPSRKYHMAGGGISHLGDYSDGGRLLRGPGDGVSDSIPAMIGSKQPARLADGEFVIPARIVSELGNGSTNAGARKLYAMMDRIQKARGKTVGKGKVAKNSKAEKYLPA